jgi:GNAT superfamily N-acetyltransferase
VSSVVETRPVGPDDVVELASLFESQRNTRHCWCMAFCTTRSQFAIGWLTGGNRRRFEGMAAKGPDPMGILASVAGEPVGWCACGPRSRYVSTSDARSAVMRSRDPVEDDSIWLLPCLFVRDGHRAQGVSYALVRAAVELARSSGAVAIEGWPQAVSGSSPADGFLGRERLFESQGFVAFDRPIPGRVIMRLDFLPAR